MAAFTAICEALEGAEEEACLADVQQTLAPCCQRLSNCGAGEFVTCVFGRN